MSRFMPKRSQLAKAFFCLAIVVQLTVLAGPAAAVDPWGTVLGAYKAAPGSSPVTAFSNGNWEWYPDRLSGHGKKWQCVEFVNRFYAAVYGLAIEGGDAKYYFQRATNKGLIACPNGSMAPPQPGDILCSEGPPYGHVAIVRAVSPEGLHIIQQNWFNDERDLDMVLSLKMEGGRYFVGNFGPKHPICGWLRSPQAGEPGKFVVPVKATPAPKPAPAQSASNS